MRFLNRATLAAVALFGFTSAASADVLSDWDKKAVAFVAASGFPQAAAECTLVMVRTAMADAVEEAARETEQESRDTVVPQASRDAAVASAAGNVLISVDPWVADRTKAMLLAYLATLPDVSGKQEGIRLGDVIARRLLGVCNSAPGGLGGG